ncbi:ATP-binding protein [Pseudonocardia sp. CA-107938]|uniref:ATP-binding protein n=1 Tax=Pseudonocardia sp. CA-107938 TaxID=3240021 RepID=UPI003D89B20B
MGGFVGRDAELATLRALLADARAGRGRLVLVAGEPGIGKTRLAAELGRLAEAVGTPMGHGRASEDAGSPPYWLFRQLARSIGWAVPELFTGRAASAAPAEARFEAFEAFAEDLRTAAAPVGLLAVLDDLQWADAASLALLVHLARGIGRSHLLVVATYRDTEPAGRAELSAALAALAHEQDVTRIRLGGLSSAEVTAQLADLTGRAVPAELSAAIGRRSGGNPFFVAELGRALDVGDGLPDVVVDAVRARLARLSGSCRALVATAAAVGVELDPELLAQLTERSVPDVLADLDEATDAGIVVGRGFVHDLVREAARSDVPTADRLAAHARAGQWLAGRADATGRSARIAHHLLESLPVGDAGQASAWAERAADDALDQFAWERAAHLYRRAYGTGAPITAARRSRLLRGEGVALIAGGAIDPGKAALAAAAGAARAAGDAAALGEVALAAEDIADAWRWGRGRLAAEALARLPTVDDPLRARLLALNVIEAGLGGEDADRRSAEALAMAERLGDRPALRSALRARQMLRSRPDGVHERLELGDRMLAIGVADSDDDTALWGRLWRFDALVMLGRLDEAEAELVPMGVLAERGRRSIARWHHLRNVAVVAMARGRFDEAVDALRQAIELVEGRAEGHSSLVGVPLSVLIVISGLTGQPDLVPAPAVEAYDRSAPAFARTIRAGACLRLGDRDRARALYAGVAPPEEWPFTSLLIFCSLLVEVAAELGPPEHLAAAATALQPYADLFVTGGAGAQLFGGSVRTSLGIAAAATGRLDTAVRELRLAVAANERVGAPACAAQARFELARVLARRRRTTDLDEAAALTAGVVDSAAALHLAPLGRDAAALAATLDRTRTGPLTRRESEVAGHVAQGLTNRQIAALLHISERTAEKHVENVLVKLGLPNRTHVASWVRTEMRTGPT